jgi:hypothetical protein
LGSDYASKIEMNTLVTDQVAPFIAVIEQAGVPALRIAFTIASILFLFGGMVIFCRRHQLFERDPDVDNVCTCSPTQSYGGNPIRLDRSDAGSDRHLVPSVARMT